MCSRTFLLILLTIGPALVSNWSLAAGPFGKVIQRSTGDREHDLIKALLSRGRFDEANAICVSSQRRAAPQTDSGALWAIRLSRVLSRQQLSADRFDNQAVERAQAPVKELLVAYPKHTRAMFLRSQLVDVMRTAARHQIILLSVSPTDQRETDAVLAQMTQVSRSIEQLKQQISNTRSEIDSRQSSLEEKSLSADLQRLQHQADADLVGISLMQTDLFAAGSRDQIAAANQAERKADDALTALPNNSFVRLEIERMRVESILRGNELERARKNLNAFVRMVGTPTPANVLAMHVQLDMRQGLTDRAGKRLAMFYQSDPESAPLSIDMDLARLEHMIAEGDPAVGGWLETIERRHGAYARRRAEAISLAKLRSEPGARSVDPSMVAAQGEDWLRRGEPARAAQLLTAAAMAETDADRAIERAMKAAAAYVKANQSDSASGVLANVATRQPTGKNSAAAHLQAAVLLSSSKQPDIAKKLEALLFATHERWPSSQAAQNARKWLLTLLERQRRFRDAADAATRFLNANSSPAEVDQTLQMWSKLIVDSDADETNDLVGEFEAAFTKLKAMPIAADRFPLVATYLLEPSSLSSLPETVSMTDQQAAFTNGILQFRRNANASPALKTVPEALKSPAIWRLIRDAQQNPRMRRPVADLLKEWGADNVDRKAMVLVWRGETKAAVDSVREATKTDPQPAARWRSLANTLSSTDQLADHQEAIKIWDRLATGVPKGGAKWHAAKLAAIELLLRANQKAEAARRAKYILLTDRPSDARLLKRYQAIAP